MNIPMEKLASKEQLWELLSSRLVLGAATVIFIGLVLSLQTRSKSDLLQHIPSVGKKGRESTRRKEFMSNGPKLYAEGYQKVGSNLSCQLLMKMFALVNETNSTKMGYFISQQLEVSRGCTYIGCLRSDP